MPRARLSTGDQARPAGPVTVVVDLDTRIRRIDPWLAAHLGWRPEQLVGRMVSVLVSKPSVPTVGAVLAHAVARMHRPTTAPPPGVTVPAPCELRAQDGPPTPALVRARATPGEHTVTIDLWLDDATAPVAAPAGPPVAAPDRPELPAPTIADVPVASALVDLDGAVRSTNAAWRALFDSPQGTEHLDDLLDAPELERVHAALAPLGAGTTDGADLEVRCRRHDGTTFWGRLRASRQRVLDPGAPPQLLLVADDVTARHHHQRELAAKEALFRSVSEASPVGIARLTPDLRFAYANPRWREIAPLGASTGHISLDTLVHPGDLERVREQLEHRRLASSSEPIQCRLRPNDAGDAPRWVNLRVTPVEDEGDDVGHVAILEDVTDLLAAREETERLAGIVESTSDLVGIADPATGRLVYLNRAARVLFAKTDAAAEAIALDDLYGPSARQRYLDEVLPALRTSGSWTGELAMHTPDGTELVVLHTITAELGPDGEPLRLAALGRDITDQHRRQEELAWLATHDPLTGLPNRALLLDRVALALARSKRDRRPVALAFCDLDGFKEVNDTLGHDAGDELLRQVATRMGSVLRPSDTVARLGGDEFVVLCTDIVDRSDALRIAARVVDAVAEPGYLLVPEGHAGDAREAQVSASVGLVVTGGDEADTVGSDELLRRADVAMYAAKQSGKNRVTLWEPALG